MNVAMAMCLANHMIGCGIDHVVSHRIKYACSNNNVTVSACKLAQLQWLCLCDWPAV